MGLVVVHDGLVMIESWLNCDGNMMVPDLYLAHEGLM